MDRPTVPDNADDKRETPRTDACKKFGLAGDFDNEWWCPAAEMAKLERELSAARSATGTSAEVLRFLLGEGTLDGVWFGDEHPKYTGKFWWRAWLRRLDSGREK